MPIPFLFLTASNDRSYTIQLLTFSDVSLEDLAEKREAKFFELIKLELNSNYKGFRVVRAVEPIKGSASGSERTTHYYEFPHMRTRPDNFYISRYECNQFDNVEDEASSQ